MKKNYDKIAALMFALGTVFFLVLAFTNNQFFNWAYGRHQNQISWYLRPLFLIPFCYFAYKRSWAGISATIFLLLTSMFWFPKPEAVSEQVKEFLQMEMDYLLGDWELIKILITMLVPVSLIALAAAFWKRNLYFGISVMVFIAVAKMTWSVVFGGEAGKSIFIPAIVGLIICIALIYYGFKRIEKKKIA
jgi:phosphate starvation-inducible membrane PsiE